MLCQMKMLKPQASGGYSVTFVVPQGSGQVTVLGNYIAPGESYTISGLFGSKIFRFSMGGAGGGAGDYPADVDACGGGGGGSSAAGLSPLSSGSMTGVFAIAGGGGGGSGNPNGGGSAGGSGGNGNGNWSSDTRNVGGIGFGAGYGGAGGLNPAGDNGTSAGFSGFSILGQTTIYNGEQYDVNWTNGGNGAVITGNYTVTTNTTFYVGAGIGGGSSSGDVDGSGGGDLGFITITTY